MADPPNNDVGCPLQLVSLNMEENKVEVNEDSLGRLEKRLLQVSKQRGTQKVAVVSVMGAFRTGKSFVLDLFLRHLRYQERTGDYSSESKLARSGNEDFKIPEWMTSAGSNIEGADDSSAGFRFKGGMDACTQGIWVWSEPFVRTLDGEQVAVLLMDTQGAWDSEMTKEQSATIFGLTAVLSSKQIYNINMQISEIYVDNLVFFMQFAQATLRNAATEMEKQGQAMAKEQIEKPFQSLDFLVRDWRYFKDEWAMDECRKQMSEHLEKHMKAKKKDVSEDSATKSLLNMFKRISCFCMPHPGRSIEKETWNGNVSDIDPDFVCFLDTYVREVFSEGLACKEILGNDLSTITFPLVLRDFVNAFHDASPVAMSFTQAMTNCTVLLAKEQAMNFYTKKMDEAMSKAPRGMAPEEFEGLNRTISNNVKAEYDKVTIFGADTVRTNAWDEVTSSLDALYQRYMQDNTIRLEKALVPFANIALLGAVLFFLDRISDFVCDWWSVTCAEASKLMLLAYVGVFGYIGFYAYVLYKERGHVATLMAGGELWKEVVRLMCVYGEIGKNLKSGQARDLVRKAGEKKSQ